MEERKVPEKVGPFSGKTQKAFTEPDVDIDMLADEDSILMSDGFNGQHDYDPFADWED